MDVKNHNMNKEKPIMRKRLKVIAFLNILDLYRKLYMRKVFLI